MSRLSLPHQHELRELQPGSAGGRALKQQRGSQYFRELGQKGGRTTVTTHGREHFVRAGRKSAATRRWQQYAGPYVRRNRFSILTVIERIVPWWPHQPARQRNRKYPILVVTDSQLEEVIP